ncbi:MAG: AsmA-like C-terminal region-containing protein [Limisphaerales bacterium]
MKTRPARPTRPWLRRLRLYFRRVRIAGWLLVLAVVCAGLYLNRVGLPGSLQRPLLDNLRARGVDLECARLRVSWHRGIVADQLRLAGTNTAWPRFTAHSADVRVDAAALLRRRVEVNGLEIRDGRLTWNLAEPGQPPLDFAITNLNALLHFQPGDAWVLERLTGCLQGADFHLTARVTNATALRAWVAPSARSPEGTAPPPAPPPGDALARLRRIHAQLREIQFSGTPTLRLQLDGDGRDPRSFNALVHVRAPGAITPWGEFTDGRLRLRLTADTATAPLGAELQLTAAAATTPWAGLRALELHTESAAPTNAGQFTCAARLRGEAVTTHWAGAEAIRVETRWTQSLTNPFPLDSTVELHATGVTSRWASATEVRLHGVSRPATRSLETNAALAWWNLLLPHALQLETDVTHLHTPQARVAGLSLSADWDAPRLAVSNLVVRFADGELRADAGLDVLHRELEFAGHAGFDVDQIEALLTPKSRAWLDQFAWQRPPAVTMTGALRLPAWTNRQPDWAAEVKPTIRLAGQVAVTNLTYRGIHADRATASLAYTNHLWQLPELVIERPEGFLHVTLASHELSHAYRIAVRGTFDPRALAGQFDDAGKRGLGYLAAETAPHLDAEITGHWYQRDTIAARGFVTWTNVSYRGQHADRVETTFAYTNGVLDLYAPRVDRPDGFARADGLRFDFPAHHGWVTNGFSTTDPRAIAAAIGPKTAAALEPYQFATPPTVTVNGRIPLRGETDAALQFDLAGGPFRWLQFNLPHVAGRITWADEQVTLTNITGQFYGGTAEGHAWFDVAEPHHTPFRFHLAVTNADLHALMSDLHSPSNRLEGIITGRLTITNALTQDWRSWWGDGKAQLRDGLIWDTPVFGIMSRVLNTIIPGLGNSRASDAKGSFLITNSVIVTRDLDIRASGMRLQYEGTVDFETRVQARVQAELLRDTWLLGRTVSNLLWPVSKLFEYEVTGTLAAPEARPIHLIPRMLLAPLNPVRTLRGIFSSGDSSPVFQDFPLEPAGPGPTAEPSPPNGSP